MLQLSQDASSQAAAQRWLARRDGGSRACLGLSVRALVGAADARAQLGAGRLVVVVGVGHRAIDLQHTASAQAMAKVGSLQGLGFWS